MTSQEAVEVALAKIEEIDSAGYELNSVLSISIDALDQARK